MLGYSCHCGLQQANDLYVWRISFPTLGWIYKALGNIYILMFDFLRRALMLNLLPLLTVLFRSCAGRWAARLASVVRIRSLITASGFAHFLKCHSATAFSSQFRNLLHDVLRRKGVLLLRLTEAGLGARNRFAWLYGPCLLDTHYQRHRRVSPIWFQIQSLGAPCNVNVSCSGYPIMDIKYTEV